MKTTKAVRPATGSSRSRRAAAITYLGALFFAWGAPSLLAAQIQISFDSGSKTVGDRFGVALDPGSALDGDGAVIQLGYYDLATAGDHFAGTWHPVTGLGTLNTGGDTGSGLPFDTTSIGDIGGGAAPGGSGVFGFTVIP